MLTSSVKTNTAFRATSTVISNDDGKNYTEFTKAFLKIQRLGITEDDLKEAMSVIMRLNPKPGGGLTGSSGDSVPLARFYCFAQNGKLEIVPNSKNVPICVSADHFSDMLNAYHPVSKQSKVIKETVTFASKTRFSKWFIDAIHQRQQTLLKTMEAIVPIRNCSFGMVMNLC
jgi:RNA polymerase sigma-54 factor